MRDYPTGIQVIRLTKNGQSLGGCYPDPIDLAALGELICALCGTRSGILRQRGVPGHFCRRIFHLFRRYGIISIAGGTMVCRELVAQAREVEGRKRQPCAGA